MACCVVGAKPNAWTNVGLVGNWIIGNQFELNLYQTKMSFNVESDFENAISNMAAILSRPHCVENIVLK